MDIWLWAGRISLILTTVWVVVQIYKHLFTKKHMVRYSETRIDGAVPNVQSYVSAYIDEKLPHVVEMFSYKIGSGSGDDRQAAAKEAIPELLAQFKRDLGYWASSTVPKAVTQIVIRNKGKRTAKKVAIDLSSPPKDFYSSSPEAKLDGAVIKIEELRPDQSITITVWADYFFGNATRVSHEDHAVVNPFTVKIEGIPGYFAEAFFVLPLAFFSWLFAIGLLLLSLSYAQRIGFREGVSYATDKASASAKSANHAKEPRR